jgi:hypothetical protein
MSGEVPTPDPVPGTITRLALGLGGIVAVATRRTG